LQQTEKKKRRCCGRSKDNGVVVVRGTFGTEKNKKIPEEKNVCLGAWGEQVGDALTALGKANFRLCSLKVETFSLLWPQALSPVEQRASKSGSLFEDPLLKIGFDFD
jgi:hypothetical protein